METLTLNIYLVYALIMVLIININNYGNVTAPKIYLKLKFEKLVYIVPSFSFPTSIPFFFFTLN